jgi:WD40 repeat protein
MKILRNIRPERRFHVVALLLSLVLLLSLSAFEVGRFFRRDEATLYTLRSGNQNPVLSLAFSPDGATLASGHDVNTDVRIWDARSGAPLLTLSGRSGGVKCLAFSPNGRVIAGGSNTSALGRIGFQADGKDGFDLRLWDLKTGALLRVIPGVSGSLETLDFLPNRRLEIAAREDNLVRFGHTEEPGRLRLKWSLGENGPVAVALLSPDHSVAACALQERDEVPMVRLRDTRTRKPLSTLRGFTSPISTLAFSRNGTRLAAGGGSSYIYVWNAQTAQLVRRLPAQSNGLERTLLCFSPDGKALAVANSAASIKLWDLQSGRLLRDIASGMTATALTFAPDGKHLAAGGSEGTVKIWDVRLRR